MKKLFPFIIFVLLIFIISSCDLLKPQENPDDKNNESPNTTEIGPNGGTISVDDIKITIPSGAFTQTANIKVTQSGSDNSGENTVTPIYSIEGLPDNYSLPIDITIKVNDQTKNETYLTLQTETFTPSLNYMNLNNIYVDATIVGDSIKGQIPAMPSDLLKTSSSNITSNTKSVSGFFSIKIFGSSNKKNYTTSNNHFKIIYDASKDNITNITNLGQYLETAYSKIENLGFSFNRRTKWPITILITNLATNVYGLFTTSLLGINNYYLRFNRLKISDQTELKTTAIHELFHFVQYLYDPRNVYSRAKFQAKNHWLNEACSVWSEELVAGSGYISDVRTGNTLTKPFEGLQAGSMGDATYHGYGMASFVKFIVTKYGKNVLLNIYDKILSGKHVFDAINNSINYNLFVDYNSFLQEYAQGKIYNDLGYDRILAIREGLFRIQTDADSVKIFAANYKELSAKIFLVRLDNQNFQDNTALNLSVNKDMCDISVFAYPKSGGEVSLISKGSKSCNVTGLKNLVTEEKYLIVMVTNSNYTSNNYKPSNLDIKLTMRVKTQKKLSIDVTINIDGATYKEKTNNENWVTLNNEKFIFTPSAGVHDAKIGSLNNNIFTSPLDDVYNPLKVESSYMKITFLENPKRINLEVELIINDATTGIKEHKKFIINNIPEEDTGQYWEYGNTLSRATIIDTYERHDYNGDYYKEFVSSNPGSNSKVEVKIK